MMIMMMMTETMKISLKEMMTIIMVMRLIK